MRELLAQLQQWLSGVISTFNHLIFEQAPQLEQKIDPDEQDTSPRLEALPPRPSLQGALAAARPDDGQQHAGLQLCVDFGTSASAVALARDEDGYELANLDVEDASNGFRPRQTVDSVFALPHDRNSPDGAVIGRLAAQLRNNPLGSHYDFYQSLKRRLSDDERGDDHTPEFLLDIQVAIEELLWLALYPKNSATLRFAREHLNLRTEYVEALDTYIGLQGDYQVDELQDGVALHLAVPNAFGAYECRILKNAAGRALENVLRRLTQVCEWPEVPFQTEPHLIREAEAVVWWEHRFRREAGEVRDPTMPSEHWLVFDVGGGSTDAAIVLVEHSEGVSVQTVRHSGVALGGNDVDELMLATMAAQDMEPGDDVNIHATKLVGNTPHGRGWLLLDYQGRKVRWAKGMANDLKGQTKEVLQEWSRWIREVVTGRRHRGKEEPVKPVGGLVTPFEPPGSTRVQLEHQDYGPRLAQYFRATVCALLDDLFESRHDEQGQIDAPIARVVISGRGSLLPGLKDAVVNYLLQRQLIRDADQVAYASADEGAVVADALKLACVKGIWEASMAPNRHMLHFVNQEITYTALQGDNKIPIWKHGSRLTPDSKARAVIHRTFRRPQIWRFYQHRFPRTMERYFPDGSRWGGFRVIGTHRLQRYGEDDEAYLIEFDCAEWTLGLWNITDLRQPQWVQMGQRKGAFKSKNNPISQLRWGWRWEGERT
ncbi:MAG: hypothetical protein AAGA48_08600 [Myxococcota bacterium]